MCPCETSETKKENLLMQIIPLAVSFSLFLPHLLEELCSKNNMR